MELIADLTVVNVFMLLYGRIFLKFFTCLLSLVGGQSGSWGQGPYHEWKQIWLDWLKLELVLLLGKKFGGLFI